MAELMFGLNQTKKKKAVKKKVKKDHDDQWNYKAKGPDGLEAYRFDQTDKLQAQKNQARETKANLKDIKAKGPDGLEAYRFEQTQKEANWKQTGECPVPCSSVVPEKSNLFDESRELRLLTIDSISISIFNLQGETR